MKCGCAPLTGPCEHLIAELRKRSPREGPFARIRTLEAENAKLRAALKIYAELEDWGYHHDGLCDYGHAAREALKACDDTKEKP